MTADEFFPSPFPPCGPSLLPASTVMLAVQLHFVFVVVAQ
uniref:Uncharacterized protein n=1 Tax=Arundo donax TaxID=35708 RepID=A0A0A9G7S8_ARUDO